MQALLEKSLFGILFPNGVTSANPNVSILIYYLSMLLPLLIGYLLGSVNSAVIISRVFYRDDIRTHGSGNGGTTNVMRTYGKAAAIGTFAGDIAKTALSVLIGALLMGEDGAYMAGLGAIIGHIFPLYFHFRGGKGVACAAALVAAIADDLPWRFDGDVTREATNVVSSTVNVSAPVVRVESAGAALAQPVDGATGISSRASDALASFDSRQPSGMVFFFR